MFLKKATLLALGAGVVLALGGAAWADIVVPVPNGDFEAGSGTNPQSEAPGWWNDSMYSAGGSGVWRNSIELANWNLYVPAWRFGGRWNPTDSHWPGATDPPGDPSPMDGPQVAFCHYGSGGTTGTHTIVSSADVCVIEAGLIYTAKVAVGTTLTWAGTDRDSKLQILANGVMVASTQTSAPASGTWTELTTILDNTGGAYTGQGLKIQLIAHANTGVKHTSFDNVRLWKTPEPATLALLGLGGVGLLIRRRRR